MIYGHYIPQLLPKYSNFKHYLFYKCKEIQMISFISILASLELFLHKILKITPSWVLWTNNSQLQAGIAYLPFCFVIGLVLNGQLVQLLSWHWASPVCWRTQVKPLLEVHLRVAEKQEINFTYVVHMQVSTNSISLKNVRCRFSVCPTRIYVLPLHLSVLACILPSQKLALFR